MRARAVLALLLATALVGCTQTTSSSDKFSGEAKAVADKVSDLESAGSRSKPADICGDILAARLKQQVAAPGSDCTAEMKKAIDDADVFKLEVTGVKVTGDRATATVKTTDRKKDVVRTFSLVKETGGWRIASFG